MSEDLAIRARPRPVKRFSRKILMAGAGGLALMLSAALAFAFQPSQTETVKNTELYNVTHKPVAEGLERLPETYADVKPVLGPPLPGDLGRAYLGTQNLSGETGPDNPFQYRPAAAGNSAPVQTNANRPRAKLSSRPAPESGEVEVQLVRQAGLFFEVGANAPDRTSTLSGSTSSDTDPFVGFPTSPQFGFGDIAVHPDMPRPKSSMAASKEIYNTGELQTPRSPYQVMAGTLIPATLVTGLNSDLPGQVVGQVTESIYDSVTGRHLLIPQGARLIGTYESRNSYGDSRAFVSWTRLIFPNGNSIVLDDPGAVDGQGFAGLEDKVDNHTGKLIKASVLSSVLGVGAELATDDDDRIVRASKNSGQQTLNIAGQRMVDRSLNVEPTITIRPGWRFSVLVGKDLVLRPYLK